MKNLYKLLQNEPLALSIINSMPSIFYIQGEDGKLVLWNKITEDLTGYTYDEIYGRDYLTFFQEKDWGRMKKINNMAFEFGYSEAEAELQLKNGKLRNVFITADKFEHIDEVYIVGVVHDISVRVKAEKDLKIALNEISKLKEELQKENIYLREEIESDFRFEEIISKSKNIQNIFKQIGQVAQTETSILIQGETGTGKELIARAIHKISKRSHKTMVKVNCASIPATLIESELFGHEKGAFTGALRQKPGRFEIADKGTLFLDEIGELPLELQPKLLRVLQDGEFERIGGIKTIKVDVRIICATNRILKDEIKTGKFRNDLYYRINVFPIYVPPLRERIQDIPLLSEYFLKKFNVQHNKKINKIESTTINKLLAYTWPGNIRELQNIIERAVITTKGQILKIENIFSNSLPDSDDSELKTFDEFQSDYLIKILDYTHWRIRGERGAAKILGMKPTTLESKMKKLGIERNEF